MKFSSFFLESDETNKVKAPHAYQNVDIAVLSVMWLSDTWTDKSFLRFASFQGTDHVNPKVMIFMLAIMHCLANSVHCKYFFCKSHHIGLVIAVHYKKIYLESKYIFFVIAEM